MARVLGLLIRYFRNYYTLHRSNLAARAAPLDPRLILKSNYYVIEFIKFVRKKNNFPQIFEKKKKKTN